MTEIYKKYKNYFDLAWVKKKLARVIEKSEYKATLLKLSNIIRKVKLTNIKVSSILLSKCINYYSKF